jgi:hypothetical protein
MAAIIWEKSKYHHEGDEKHERNKLTPLKNSNFSPPRRQEKHWIYLGKKTYERQKHFFRGNNFI